MNLAEAIEARHSVRAFTDRPIEADIRTRLQEEVDACNAESGLHIQLAFDEPDGFSKGEKSYGQFSNVRNYLVLAGPKSADLGEKCGYYGERIVLLAQTLGLNSCWVALTYNKKGAHVQLAPNEKMALVVALGYGETQGKAHKVKESAQVSNAGADAPEWFAAGIRAALLAPTAMNQQKFLIERTGSERDGKPVVRAKAKLGPYAKVDLGIVKYHFEIGAGTDNFVWE